MIVPILKIAVRALARNKARSALNLAQIIDKRQRLLSMAAELRAGRVCRRRSEGCSAECASPAASALTVPSGLR